jgi:signal transduction histidine kinase
VRVTAILGLDGEPQSILSISRDITAEHDGEQSVRDMNVTLTRHLAERTAELGVSNASLLAETGVREAAEAQVRQLQKMEAVGLLTGGIAHDFNNMLAVIIGALNLVERRIAKGQDVQELLDGAMDGAKRAATLTQRLLAFSRQLPLAPEPVNANSLVGSMSEMLRRVLGEATPLETVLAGGLWKTSADPGQLEGAILNLAINARDAMPNGGRLTIETANAHLDDAYARTHTEVSAGQYVMIAVSDTGTGMPPEVAAKAFDPFFTTKGVGKGTGLGLSQVYGFVKQSHGHVKIYTEVGEGTAVKVYLPRLLASTETAAAVPARHHPVPTGTLEDVILVVEDEERMREISSASLRELGYTVLHASSAASALRLLETNPQITVLFTDIVMPDMNGRELADEAVKLRPGLKVLFTTGYTRNAIVHGGRLDAGVNFLAKPFTLDELGQKMSDVIKRR